MPVLMGRVGELHRMTGVAAFDRAAIEVNQGADEQTLKALDTRTQQIGNVIVRRLFRAQWAIMDRQLTEAGRTGEGEAGWTANAQGGEALRTDRSGTAGGCASRR